MPLYSFYFSICMTISKSSSEQLNSLVNKMITFNPLSAVLFDIRISPYPSQSLPLYILYIYICDFLSLSLFFLPLFISESLSHSLNVYTVYTSPFTASPLSQLRIVYKLPHCDQFKYSWLCVRGSERYTEIQRLHLAVWGAIPCVCGGNCPGPA